MQLGIRVVAPLTHEVAEVVVRLRMLRVELDTFLVLRDGLPPRTLLAETLGAAERGTGQGCF